MIETGLIRVNIYFSTHTGIYHGSEGVLAVFGLLGAILRNISESDLFYGPTKKKMVPVQYKNT